MGILETNATKLRELHERLKHSFHHRHESQTIREDWKEAAKEFHEQYDRLAYPGGLSRFLSRLSSKDPETIELVIEYLEADPWYFRSGYVKEQLLRYLKRVPLTGPQRLRLQYLILRKVQGKWTREFRYYAHLANVVADVEFIQRLTELLKAEPTISQRAQFVISCCRSVAKAK